MLFVELPDTSQHQKSTDSIWIVTQLRRNLNKVSRVTGTVGAYSMTKPFRNIWVNNDSFIGHRRSVYVEYSTNAFKIKTKHVGNYNKIPLTKGLALLI